MKKYWPELGVSLLLIAAALAVYLQAITFELVHAEDFVLYHEIGARMKAFGCSIPGILHMPSNAVYFVPISNFAVYLDLWLSDYDMGMLHLMNVTVHIMNSVQLFWVLRLATACLWRSAFAAALFALHPINADNVVCWCRGATLLTALFFLATILAYLYYARKPSLKKYCLVIFCFILGLLAKPSIIFLPVILLLFDFWPLGRWQWAKDNMALSRFATAPLIVLIREKVPLFILPAVWMGLFALVIRMGPDLPVNIPRPDNYVHLLNIPVTYVYFLWKMVSPFNLPFNFPDTPLVRSSLMPVWQIISALSLLALITAAVIYLRRKFPFIFTGWLWFIVCLAPYAVLCVAQQRPIIPRYAYLPMIGISILGTWGGTKMLIGLGSRRTTIWIIAVVLLSFCMTTSAIQARRWSDKTTYFSHAVDVFPDCEQRRSNLGEVLYDKGLIDETITQLNIALEINPDFFVAHNHLGLALVQRGEQGKALFHLKKAVQLKPDYPEAHNNLANLLADTGDLDGAVRHYQEALRVNPNLFQAHNNLGTVLMQKGRYDQAIAYYKKSLSLNPAYHIARDNLARAEALRKQRP